MSDPMPAPPAPSDPKHEPLLCEFCESKLTRRGQVIDLSEKARVLRRQQDTIDKQGRTIEEQAAEVTRLSAELAEAKAALSKSQADEDDDDPFADFK
jgi:septal ring factor EnvC (AmiA/AmiB activator)